MSGSAAQNNENNIIDFPIETSRAGKRAGSPDNQQPRKRKSDGPPPIPPGRSGKFRAKRFNEQIKAAYGFLNTLAGAVLLTAWIGPLIRGEALPMGLDNPALVIGGFGLHIVGQFLVWKFTRPEE